MSMPNGSVIIWSYDVYNFHAVDNDILYITGIDG
jgi:hypothetical protein